MEPYHHLLIHTVKAVAYRFDKATNSYSENFGDFRIGEHTRSPREIVNHMRDLVNKTKTRINEGHFQCPPPDITNFAQERQKFLDGLNELKILLTSATLDQATALRLLQGPLLDMATHVGQLAMLNGLDGNKVQKENYFSADL